MKRKLLIGLIAMVVLPLVVFHLGPVEKLIFREIQHQAAKAGFELDARDFDWNLPLLRVRLEGMTLKGHGLDAEIEEVLVDGDAALLLGRMHFDDLLVSQGQVHFQLPTRDPNAGPAPPNKPNSPTWPAIFLAHGQIEKIAARINGVSQNLNLEARKIAFDRQATDIALSLETPSQTIGSTPIPEATLKLNAKSNDFRTFQNIALDVHTEQSQVRVTGALQAALQPQLEVYALLADSPLPPGSQVTLTAEIQGPTIELQMAGNYLYKEKPYTLDLNSNFNWQDLQNIPIQLVLAREIEGNIQLAQTRDQWSATWELAGPTTTISDLHPLIRISHLELSGRGNLPKGGTPNAQFQLKTHGEQVTVLKGRLENRVLSGEGQLQLAHGTDLNFQARYLEQLEVDFSGHLDRAAHLQPYLPLPPELCLADLYLEGRISTDFKAIDIQQFAAHSNHVAYADWVQSDLNVAAQGRYPKVAVNLFASALNQEAPSVTAEIDLEDLAIETAHLALDTKPLQIAGQRLVLRFEGQAQGPFQNPSADGLLDVWATPQPDQAHDTASDLSPKPSLQLSSLWSLNEGIFWENLQLESAHGELAGSAYINLGFDQWSLDLQGNTQHRETFSMLLPTAIPHVNWTLSGNNAALEARVFLEPQNYPVAGYQLPLDARGPLKVSGNPTEPQFAAIMDGVEAAGILLSNLDLAFEQDRLRFSSFIKLENPEILQNVFAEQWPKGLNLHTISGLLDGSAQTNFTDLSFNLGFQGIEAAFREHPILVRDFNLQYAEQAWSFDPFEIRALGLFAEVRPYSNLDLSDFVVVDMAHQNPDRLTAAIDFFVEDPSHANALLADYNLADAGLKRLEGQAYFSLSPQFTDPRGILVLNQLEGAYQQLPINGNYISAGYDGELRLGSFEIHIDDMRLEVADRPYGTRVAATLNASDLEPWLEDLRGNANLAANLDWMGRSLDGCLVADVRQKDGKLLWLQPLMEITNLRGDISWRYGERLEVEGLGADVNGGPISVDGYILPRAETPDMQFDVTVNGVLLDFNDYQARIISSMRWRLQGEARELVGQVLVSDGQARPTFELFGLARDLLSAYPEIHFPDPLLESIDLRIAVLTLDPLVVNHDIAYLELEVPALYITGNLASPKPGSGTIVIREGSTLALANDRFIFQPSQIQFHPNRPSVPYLQLFLEYGSFNQRKPLTMTGYTDELDKNLGTTDITTIVANLLLERSISTKISLESDSAATVFDKSSTFFVEKQLDRKVVTRLGVPLEEPTKRRFELGLGPFRNFFLNLATEEEENSYSIKRRFQWGYNGNRPLVLERIRFKPAKLPKWVRRDFPLRNGDMVSETRRRWSETDLRRKLRARGYLQPEISTEIKGRTLTINLDMGPQTQLEIKGLSINTDQRARLFNRMREPVYPILIERMVSQMALAQGHLDPKVTSSYRGETLVVDVKPGPKLQKPQVHFGPAQALLGDMYRKTEDAHQLITTYMVSPGKVVHTLRGRLAALGYIHPEIDKGYFEAPNRFLLPVDPGPHASLVAVHVDGQPIGVETQPFHHDLIGKMKKRISRDFDYKRSVVVVPKRNDDGIWFDVSTFQSEEPTFDTLEIAGNKRIRTHEIERYLGFEPGMTQSKLVHNQQLLIKNGPFRSVRLATQDDIAKIEVEERNRWESTVDLGWQDLEGTSIGVQFVDRMVFNRMHQLNLRLERSEVANGALGMYTIHRIFGSVLDFRFSFDWNEELEDLDPSEPIPGPLTTYKQTLPDQRQYTWEIEHNLSPRQQIRGSYVLQDTRITSIDQFFIAEPFTAENLLFEDRVLNRSELASIRFAWIYEHLDNETAPKNGMFSNLSLAYYDETLGADPERAGQRLAARLGYFKTMNRWLWTQRAALGLFRPEIEGTTIGGLESGQLFSLGGPDSVRGFQQDSLGPSNAGELLGGESMFFASQEMNYDLNLAGLGLSLFVDTGWVWEGYDDFFSTDLVITGGLGLTFNSPVGYFRLDWARPLSNGPMSSEDRQRFRDEFHFRIGRSF